MMSKITAKSYTLWEEGEWLAQVILTSDGMFSAVSEYGNFAYAWRAIGNQSIEEFVCQLNTGYFADKMALGLVGSINRTKQMERACQGFAEKVLPSLQKVLREELEQEESEC